MGRNCNDYARLSLCTFAGEYGPGWVYVPPRSFNDFAREGIAAHQACCACGGGVGCSRVRMSVRSVLRRHLGKVEEVGGRGGTSGGTMGATAGTPGPQEDKLGDTGPLARPRPGPSCL